MQDEYSYQTYYKKKPYIMKRDNYTCQVCGYYGIKEKDVMVRRCITCEKKGIPFHPDPNYKIPKPCVEKGLKYRVCGECPNFTKKSETHALIEKLTVHHKDGNKKNQNPENLVTVCTSCARRVHPCGRIRTLEEVKKDKDAFGFLKN